MRRFYCLDGACLSVFNLLALMSKKFTLCLISLLVLATSAVQAQDYTVFQTTDGPTAPKYNDGQGITVGMKFQSSINGYINGIRYYKAPGTTGTHTGTLWTSNGTKLAEVVFMNETASGWQQAIFNSSVAITANATYIATYYSESGDYAATNPYFTQPVVNGPLRALAADEEGPNGIYLYSVAPAFPSVGFMSPNYWVDVVFSTTFMPDVTPPGVVSYIPDAGSATAAINEPIAVAFTEDMDPASFTTTTFLLKDAANNQVPAFINVAFNEALLTPFSPLTNSSAYSVTVKGGVAGVKDKSGNYLQNDLIWSFTTKPLPVPEGHGGPILVLSAAANPFSRYTSEIMRAEGLNGFITKDITQTNAADMATYDVVILGEMPLNAAQVAMLTNWVNAGGTLIAFRPSAELSSLLGITKVNNTLSNKYLKVNTASGPGAGIVSATMQYHGDADLYTLNGAISIATLYSDANTATTYPAVTMKTVGANGGKAVAYTFDLAKSIVYTRQGNPAWAGQKRSGTEGPIRSNDLFTGVNEPDWIDFNKIDIPQADEQQRLLANIILQGSLHRKPMPRLWFLPSGHKAAVVMTGDDHFNNGTTGQFNHMMTHGPNTSQDVADWKAVRGTSYIYSGTLTNSAASAFEAQGFEVALHVSTGCADFTAASLQNNIGQQLSQFATMYPGVPAPTTSRTHCIAWSDWATAAKVEAQNGIRLDVNYYYWPGSWVQDRPGMFTGSGMPMRFADKDGSMIDCYQVPTQLTDESEISYAPFIDQLLNKALGSEGYYGVFTTNMHTDSAVHSGANAVIDAATARGVPVISARQLLKWLDGRNGTSFSNTTWTNNVLTFTITAGNDARNLRAMLPYVAANGGQLTTLTRNGSALAFTVETIKGMQYAFFPASVGTATYVATYNASPVVSLQPVNTGACINQQVTLKSAATGTSAPTVQWQSSTNGTTWTNISGATNGTYTFTAVAADHNKQYRAVWTNTGGVTNSDAAKLTINAVPVLTSGLADDAITSTLFSYVPTSSTAGTSFTWTRAAVAGISNAAGSGTGNVQETLVNTAGTSVNVTYVYKLTTPGGCTNTQNVVVTVSPVACTVSSTIAFNFNNNKIHKGRYIWFNSAIDPSNLGSGPVHFFVKNSKITFRANNQDVTITVPDAVVKFDAAVSMNAASTQWVNNSWKTTVPLTGDGNVFMTGLSYLVPKDLPANISNVRWSADISSDRPGVVIKWRWAAAVYSNFTGNAGLQVKPIDAPLQIFGSSIDEAGTPMNYKFYVIPGATGQGLVNIMSIISGLFGGNLSNLDILNYTGSYSAAAQGNCNTGMYTRGGRNEIVVITPAAVERKITPRPDVVDEKLEVTAMPNPSSGYFTVVIRGNSRQNATVRIVDVTGRVMEQYQNMQPNSVLRIGDKWKAGMYIVEVVRGGERQVVKLIKAN